MSARTKKKTDIPVPTASDPTSIRSTTRFVAIAATVAVVAVAGGVGLVLAGDDDVAPVPAEASGQDNAPDAVAAPEPVPSSEAKLTWVFTGESGPDGCSYDGPSVITAGTVVTSAVNDSNAEVSINIDQLAAGKTYEDFLAHLGASDGNHPVVASPEDHDPATHEWLKGEWRTVHRVPAGTTYEPANGVPLFEGDFVMFCWIPGDEPGTSKVWPAGKLTVTAP